MKTIIIYKSKYGASKDYARLLSERINAPFYSVDDVNKDTLANCDRVIFFSGIYASKIAIASFIKKNTAILQTKETTIVFSGITPFEKNAIDKYYLGNFKTTPFQDRAFFYLPGRLDLHELKGMHKMLINMVQNSLEKIPKEQRTPGDEQMLSLKDKEIDLVKSENLDLLVEFLS